MKLINLWESINGCPTLKITKEMEGEVKRYDSDEDLLREGLNNNLKVSTFDNLPIDYKKGVLIWMYEGDKVDWSVDDVTDWVNDRRIHKLINEYSKEYGNESWEFGLISTSLIINKVTQWIKDDGYYKSFDEFHKAYQSTNSSNHGNSILPIIVSDNNPEYIDDGWHRFNFYITKGYSQIPILRH